MKFRIPPRLLGQIQTSDDHDAYRAGRFVLPADLALFKAIDAGRLDADGAVVADVDLATVETIAQWAQLLRTNNGRDEFDRRANVRTANAVLRRVEQETKTRRNPA